MPVLSILFGSSAYGSVFIIRNHLSVPRLMSLHNFSK